MKIELDLKSRSNRDVKGKRYYKWYLEIPAKVVNTYNLKKGDLIAVEITEHGM